LANRNLGTALYYARRYDEAVEQFQKAIELNPSFPVVYNWLGWLCAATQMDDQAVSWELKHMGVGGGNPARLAESQEFVKKYGSRAYWRKELDDAKKLGPRQDLRPYGLPCGGFGRTSWGKGRRFSIP
jgi:tetratricopeptide (TPR) repeat protein